jgi:hypothetical protein
MAPHTTDRVPTLPLRARPSITVTTTYHKWIRRLNLISALHKISRDMLPTFIGCPGLFSRLKRLVRAVKGKVAMR